MKDRFKGKSKTWLFVSGILLLISITPVPYVQAAELTDDEIYWITYMREEEKLARDVYIFLHDLWGSLLFNTIAASEETHMDAIKTLLDKYGIEDPAAGKDLGVFVNDDLKTLYTDLTNAGSKSLIDALRVGVFIEMTDIADLTQGIATAKHNDIKTVYHNLRNGSQNHWDAFCSHLVKLGAECKPYELLEQ